MTQISLSYVNPIKARFGDEFFSQIPTESGVYYFLDADDAPLYIGKADSLRKRLRQYATAKPGQVREHTLEMLEMAERITWELTPDGTHALVREGELLRVLKPPFNILGVEAVPYIYIGTRVGMRDAKGDYKIDFRLSYSPLPRAFKSYGCFKNRGKAKAGYSALLRLLYASTCTRERFLLPAKISRSSPAYVHSGHVPAEMREPLNKFLRGESFDLLKMLTKKLLLKENIQPHLYASIQRDLNVLKEFFVFCAHETRSVAVMTGLDTPLISQQRMDNYLEKKVRTEIPPCPISIGSL